MKDRDPSDPFHHDREASLEAEIALLRRSLDEAVRRVAEGSPSVAIEHEREIAKGRAALALADTRAAELEGTVAHLTARLAALGHSEARYRLAVESARDYAIFTLDLSGRITGWNTGAENLLGWDEAEALGRAVNVIFTPEVLTLGDVEDHAALAL